MIEMPVIELSVRSMKHSIVKALTDYQLELSSEIARAVEAWCAPENVQRVVAEEVRRVLDAVVKEEVDKFYRYGAGGAAVRDAVVERLTPRVPMDPDITDSASLRD